MPSKKFIFFCCMYKWLILVSKITLMPRFCTIKIGNKKLCWVKMNDVQNGIGVKNMPDLVRKKFVVFLVLKFLQKIKSKNTKDAKMNCIIILTLLLRMFVVISCQE